VRRISPGDARALLAVTGADARALRTRQVPAHESRTRLLRLVAAEPDVAELAARLGVTTETLTVLAGEDASWCSALLALRLLTLARSTATDDPALARAAAA